MIQDFRKEILHSRCIPGFILLPKRLHLCVLVFLLFPVLIFCEFPCMDPSRIVFGSRLACCVELIKQLLV